MPKIDQTLHSKFNTYGFAKYYNGQDVLPPDDDLQQILQLEMLDYGHDFKFAMKCT